MTGGGRLAAWSVRVMLALLCLYAILSLPGFAMRWGLSFGGLALFAGWAALAVGGVMALRRPPSRVLLAVLAVAIVAVRLAATILAAGRESTGDPHAYLVLADSLIAGRGMGLFEPFFGSFVRALYPPLYPLLLAGWGTVAGLSTGSVLVLGTLIDAIAAWLIVRLAIRLGSSRVGPSAAWLYLVWPSVVFSAPLAQKEGLCVVLVLALTLGWLGEPRGWRGALAIGLPAGLLALTQPGEAPLAALFGLVLVRRLGLARVLHTGLRAAPVALLTMLPWWLRNALVFGTFVPLTSAGGASLWIGNNPAATGNWMPLPDALRGLPEITYGKRAGMMAIEWITSHPIDFVRLTATKFVRACGSGIFAVTRAESMRPVLGAGMAAMLWPASHGAHLALLGAGAVRAAARAVPPLLFLLIVACGLQLLLFGVWFEFGERHRDFVTPFLLLLACWTVEKPAATP